MPSATTAARASRPPVVLEAGALAVEFEWDGDRWRHRVTCGGRLVAESVEGSATTGDPRWPASPPLQEVSAAEIAGRPAVLAVGAAGRTHFSASLTIDPSSPDTVLVEVACRIQEPAGWLGSTYRTAAGDVVQKAAAPPAAPPATVEWAYRIAPGGIAPAPPRPTPRA